MLLLHSEAHLMELYDWPQILHLCIFIFLSITLLVAAEGSCALFMRHSAQRATGFPWDLKTAHTTFCLWSLSCRHAHAHLFDLSDLSISVFSVGLLVELPADCVAALFCVAGAVSSEHQGNRRNILLCSARSSSLLSIGNWEELSQRPIWNFKYAAGVYIWIIFYGQPCVVFCFWVFIIFLKDVNLFLTRCRLGEHVPHDQ